MSARWRPRFCLAGQDGNSGSRRPSLIGIPLGAAAFNWSGNECRTASKVHKRSQPTQQALNGVSCHPSSFVPLRTEFASVNIGAPRLIDGHYETQSHGCKPQAKRSYSLLQGNGSAEALAAENASVALERHCQLAA